MVFSGMLRSSSDSLRYFKTVDSVRGALLLYRSPTMQSHSFGIPEKHHGRTS